MLNKMDGFLNKYKIVLLLRLFCLTAIIMYCSSYISKIAQDNQSSGFYAAQPLNINASFAGVVSGTYTCLNCRNQWYHLQGLFATLHFAFIT